MLRIPRVSSLVLSSAILAAHAAAQGSDDCATATPISGTGLFAVSTLNATDSPEQNGVCVASHRDVWFKWTATTSQNMDLSLCGSTITDTVIAVYPGAACPVGLGTQIACNDDACSEQSQLFFDATAGNSYLIQIGAWHPLPTFTGTFSLQASASPCGAGNGPDVIIGEITDVQNVASGNGLDAFTVGTTACNVGDTVVQWWGATNEHPVISETFYKHKIVGGAGRFEQIGMSWLKHGFAADVGSLCCTCQNPGNSQLLGVGCSDPYSASQAGAQNGLTPRYQVNAHTGAFPYPGANPGWSGSTARRCEVPLAELEPSSSSVHYYIEATYITADDATAGNNNNNASTKEMTVTGGPTNFTFATTGPILLMQPAILSWPVVEPGVTLTDVQVPGDGLFIVGSNATSLGGGQYRYEFAVHNMNVDRDCGSFSVPIPAGVVVSNVGFHDVTYRNGDGVGNVSQSSTDWVGVVAGGAITWSTETPAQNANANAIRWASQYNFRFDANVPPTGGAVTVGLWSPGSPSSVAAAAEVPGGEPSITAFCAGDGSGAPCPCGNSGAPDHGCDNSAATGGSLLAASGVPSLSADTVQLVASGELPTALSIFLQGTTAIAPVNYGDGLRCTGGALKRLFNKSAVGGTVTAPQGADPTVSARSAAMGATIPLGATRLYQVYYRDNSGTFCPDPPGNTFNASNALSVTWGL